MHKLEQPDALAGASGKNNHGDTGTAGRRRQRIKDALAYLADIGFELELTPKTYRNIAANGFDRRTLPQSFVLAQILVENQPITVRGAFYRAVSAGIYPDTAEANYRQVCAIVLKLRRASIIPYAWIADSTRIREKPSSWSGLEDFGETVRDCYRKDLWARQISYVEVAVEKDAMAGILRPITSKFDIYLNVVRGNASETFLWNWAESLKDIEKPITIYYLGDHDPNGLDIERDIQKRLGAFVGRPFSWQRLSVTADDFQRDDILGFPVRGGGKAWKSRCDSYVAVHGDRCVEVDAIPPNEIRERLRTAIEQHIDQAEWKRLQDVERMEKETINQVFTV